MMSKKPSFPRVEQAELFLGAPYTGKTQSLLAKINNLLSKGVDSSEILVFCATPDAAQSLNVRLHDLSSKANEVTVITPRQYFSELLSTQAAGLEINRRGRLLLPFEYDFLLEDLKTSGIRPQRLREILAFFCKGLSELADDDEDWLITNEESELFDLLQSCLSFTGAILEPELGNLAVRYLRTNSDALAERQMSHIFVDDFHLLSRASQFASCLLAKDSIYLSANKDVAVQAYESYPYAAGVAEFIATSPAVVVTELDTVYSSPRAAKASRAYCVENSIDVSHIEYAQADSAESFELLVGETPIDEATKVADYIAQLVKNGVPANNIVVAAPHLVWQQNIARQLVAIDIPAEVLEDGRFLRSDIRDNEESFNARFLTLLSLAASAADAVAWRCWIGFGDYLANSNGMRMLRNLARVHEQTLDVVLGAGDLQFDTLDELNEVASAQRILKIAVEARQIIDRLGAYRGGELLDAIAKELGGSNAQVPDKILELLSEHKDVPTNNDAASMTSFVRSCLEFPTYRNANALKVVSYENVVGLNPRYLFLAGFMNGFFPKHDYFDATILTIEQMEKRHAKDLSQIANIVAKTSEALIVSYSQKLSYEDAKRLQLVIKRIVLDDNKRVAKTEPSLFLRSMEQ